MKKIKLAYVALFIALTGLWLMADTVLSTAYSFFALRASLINYSGILGIGVMSVAMILAVRPVLFEPYLGGLDKMYRLHKWLGITGLVISVIHWAWAQVPKWLVGAGLIERPVRIRPPAETVAIFQYFQSQRGLAEGIGEWAFYAAVVLIILALVKRFPYRHFFKTHRLLAIVYLFLVFHAVVLMKFSFWGEVLGPVMAALMIGGSVAAFVVLFRRVGQSRQTVGEIEAIAHHKDLQVIEVTIQFKGRWAGHEAGQFAFVTFDEKEGAHPFTISSAWKGDGRIAFIIKGLGDYTHTLSAALKAGDVVKVEGPYGRFNFRSSKPRQIWVGGGIGITPFIARMKVLANQPDGTTIDLFHTTAVLDEAAIGKLERDALAANVRLHVLVDARDGLLSTERICQAIPQWQSADIWFCGPAGFGQALRKDFIARGLPPDDFHQELFHIR
ncbi:ferric reductase-like transmembrane domain-containing protein [Rhodoferax sp.]|uniref:ferredoxin reductase family protein n=1 Tax=Rhodoferax sp. TaxID=50421 RepID=UPI00271D416C|nr:ferric reductase-like transmembrane domain-containing protein [Rhodoferax sp.]MDO9194916.1 ferric reductase-like transmembrane domain-containing protein [Rhodoferax sp.]